MRNFIRTSHDQRRRSSAAANAEQLAYLSALSQQGAPLTTVDGVKMAAGDIRRSSMGGDPAMAAATASKAGVSQLLGGGQDRRRGSLTGSTPCVTSVAGAGLGVGGGSGVQASPRRRWNCDKAHRTPLNKIDTFNMEIKQSSVLAIVLIVCAVCAAVVILAYTVKSYL